MHERVRGDREVSLPIRHLVLAEEDLAPARAVDLHPIVGDPGLDGLGVAEDHRATAVEEDAGRAVVAGGVEAERLRWTACGGESLADAVRRPRLARAGSEHQRDLEGDRRNPQRVDARRVRRQNDSQAVGLAQEADEAIALPAVARIENVEIESARQPGEHRLEVVQHVVDLRHVGPRQRLWHSGGRRQLTDVVVRRLRVVAQRQLAVAELLSRGTADRQQVLDRQLAEIALRLAHPCQIAPDQPGVRLAHLGHRLARRDVVETLDGEAAVRPAAPQNGQMEHQ